MSEGDVKTSKKGLNFRHGMVVAMSSIVEADHPIPTRVTEDAPMPPMPFFLEGAISVQFIKPERGRNQ